MLRSRLSCNTSPDNTHEYFTKVFEEGRKSFDNTFTSKADNSVSANDFSALGIIGEGGFGTVILVQSKKDKHLYANKVMRKSVIMENIERQKILDERNILRACDFPFIVKYFSSFKDNANVYLVMEYVHGIDLFSLMRFEEGNFSEAECKHYAAQVLLALQYLHNLNIVYRDLKPENILLDLDGHVKITDFGLAKYVEGRTYTLCGTPDYIAPEQILNKGHNCSVDWWAFGVLIYEMREGVPPFYSSKKILTYEKITKGDFHFNLKFSRNIRSLIRGLLEIDLTKRLGNMKGGAEDIMFHPWFNSIKWRMLYEKKVKCPNKSRVRRGSKIYKVKEEDAMPIVSSPVDLWPDEFANF